MWIVGYLYFIGVSYGDYVDWWLGREEVTRRRREPSGCKNLQ